MLMKVQITERSSGRIIVEYPIVSEMDESEEDYCDDAWENAVEDGLVDEGNKDNYDIEVVEDIPHE